MSEKDDMSDTLLSYLRSHPNAADTVEGIVSWWLPRQRFEETLASVQQALDDLVTQGLIAKTTLADGTVLYRSLEQDCGPKH